MGMKSTPFLGEWAGNFYNYVRIKIHYSIDPNTG